MIKDKLTKYFDFFKKIPPWQIISGGILVIIFLSLAIIFFTNNQTGIFIVDREYILKKLPEKEKSILLNFFNETGAKAIKIGFLKNSEPLKIKGQILRQNDSVFSRAINLLGNIDYQLKLYKKKNTLKFSGKKISELALPSNSLVVLKNIALDKIYLDNNLNLESLLAVDNLENNLSESDKKVILKILSQLEELSINAKADNFSNLASFDYQGILSYNSEKELKSFEDLISKISSFTKPEKKVKKLPDSSEVAEFFSNPQNFPFRQEKYSDFTLHCQKVAEKSWQICYLKDKNKIYFSTNLDYFKEKLNNNLSKEAINLSNNPDFLDQDKLLVINKKLLVYSELAKNFFSDFSKFSYLAIMGKDSYFRIYQFLK